jgi:hypothetical protein
MKLFRTISSLLLATLVLMASSSFYVGVHTCGGTVKAVAFLEEADDCGHQSLPPCHRQLMKGCCENENIMHDGDDFKSQSSQITVEIPFATELEQVDVLVAEIIPSVLSTVEYPTYDPPLRTSDKLTTLQVFLI